MSFLAFLNRLVVFGAALLGLYVMPVWAGGADAKLAALLSTARQQLPHACDQKDSDLLFRVLCDGKIRIGVRDMYPLFATKEGGERAGYDIDVAREIARRLDVEIEWVSVTPATRISSLVVGEVDIVIATMGHNTRRDEHVRFIRPHYYRSETIIVGAKDVTVRNFEDLHGRTVCTTIGNLANAEIIANDTRVLLFNTANRLSDALLDQSCHFAAHDDSFFAFYLAQGALADGFERKFGIDPVPWGIATSRQTGMELAALLDLMSQIMHRDGVLVSLGRRHGIYTQFLEEQQFLWRSNACGEAAGSQANSCLLPALHNLQEPTRYATQIEAALNWSEETLGFAPALPMLMTKPAWDLFVTGVYTSLILVFGALIATIVISLIVGWAYAQSFWLSRCVIWVLIVTLQSSPVLLTLVVVTAVAHAMFTYSAAVSIGAAIVALGLMNGVNAGQAIGEAAAALRREGDEGASFYQNFRTSVRHSLPQIMSFLVNAAKGTPIASFTGAPELLATLTDITSFASGRVVTYSFVLVFYILVVALVVWGCGLAKSRVESWSQS